MYDLIIYFVYFALKNRFSEQVNPSKIQQKETRSKVAKKNLIRKQIISSDIDNYIKKCMYTHPYLCFLSLKIHSIKQITIFILKLLLVEATLSGSSFFFFLSMFE